MKKFEVIFDLDIIQKKLLKRENLTLNEDFWINKSSAHKTLKKIKIYNDKIDFIKKLDDQLELLLFHLEVVSNDKVVSKESKNQFYDFRKYVEKLEVDLVLNDIDDSRDAILSIHPGAGGKESQDWAFMLFRMYKRWVSKESFDMSILNYQDGEDNGLKEAVIEIKGNNAYGYLKSEMGVHRLVRISPFDSNSRRHTSFASIFVYPIVDDAIDIVLNESDLKIDTYRASGAGGQHVNKTDSAVRITHMPSGTVVQCQNQRSQLKNKNIAMKILSSKLYQKKLQELNNEKNKLNESKADIAWGSQIRSYIFHPYNMIKDHRTKYETSNTSQVLDGDLNNFIRKYLLYNMEKNVK